MKKLIFVLIIIILLGVGAFFYFQKSSDKEVVLNGDLTATTTDQTNGGQTAEPEEPEKILSIGKSVEGRDIMAYRYGEGEKEILFVGGIHGGYSWNTALVAYELIKYLEDNPSAIPQNVSVTIIPVLNPDGLNKIVGTTSPFTKADVPASREETIAGRFNANIVDLNRNFDCEWQTSGVWQNTKVSGGSAVFSEPESKAIRDYIEQNKPAAAVVWYSAAGGVFASSCRNGVLAETRTITNLYSVASGYRAYEEFDFYDITGDMVNWLAKKEIPAISVLLSTHSDTEWEKNRKGIESLLNHFGR